MCLTYGDVCAPPLERPLYPKLVCTTTLAGVEEGGGTAYIRSSVPQKCGDVMTYSLRCEPLELLIQGISEEIDDHSWDDPYDDLTVLVAHSMALTFQLSNTVTCEQRKLSLYIKSKTQRFIESCQSRPRLT